MRGISQEVVKDLFDYHPDGYLVYKVTRAGCRGKAGDRLGGNKITKSYRQASIYGVVYREHQLIWLWHTGRWPSLIDHKDHDRLNNRIENLRELTHKENIRHGSGKQAGITKYKNNKWIVGIYVDCKKIHIGIFDTYEEALSARKSAEERFWK